MMDYINLQIAPDKVITLAYRHEYPTFIFEHDIEINGWIVGHIIKLGGPQYSTYKYNFKNYLEFVITDPKGIQHIKTWQYNQGDDEMRAFWDSRDGGLSNTIRHYLVDSPIFRCANWEDYDAWRVINKVKTIINSTNDNISKLKNISKILK